MQKLAQKWQKVKNLVVGDKIAVPREEALAKHRSGVGAVGDTPEELKNFSPSDEGEWPSSAKGVEGDRGTRAEDEGTGDHYAKAQGNIGTGTATKNCGQHRQRGA